MITRFRKKMFFLSNFYLAPVYYNGLTFKCNEAAFQAQKTLDPFQRDRFINLDPDVAKKIGRHVKLRDDWEQVKDQIMYEIVYAKFTQNKELGDMLISTGNQELREENTWNDDYWGIDRNHGNRGQNKLGKILMRVRNELVLVENNYNLSIPAYFPPESTLEVEKEETVQEAIDNGEFK